MKTDKNYYALYHKSPKMFEYNKGLQRQNEMKCEEKNNIRIIQI
jgi:hypothetical protein